MHLLRNLTIAALLAFVGGLWVGCSIGFDPTAEKYACESDSDCLENSQFKCINGVCAHPGGDNNGSATCDDSDGDGYGVGDVTSGCTPCKNCTDQADCDIKCKPDCNDDDPEIYPGAPEACDGVDNDCNEDTPDGQSPCDSTADCPPANTDAGYQYSCENGQCVAKMNLQFPTPPCSSDPLACQSGSVEQVPDECK